MTTFKIDYPAGATPLNPNEIDGLIPDYITTQGELNELDKERIGEELAQLFGDVKYWIENQTFEWAEPLD